MTLTLSHPNKIKCKLWVYSDSNFMTWMYLCSNLPVTSAKKSAYIKETLILTLYRAKPGHRHLADTFGGGAQNDLLRLGSIHCCPRVAWKLKVIKFKWNPAPIFWRLNPGSLKKKQTLKKTGNPCRWRKAPWFCMAIWAMYRWESSPSFLPLHKKRKENKEGN